ncbi:MAG: efflux RND transporter permease subunit, partial [Bdellovibrionales bacterium]|nr:efflux RND transporter permease subunit [Bdellovibrionales bacterium]
MINKIIYFSVHNRVIVFIFTALFILVGWGAYESLTIDAMPDITNVQVSVNTMVEGLAPEEAERYITIPIESVMNGIAGVTHVRSLTKFGLAQVVVNFEDGTDIYRARQQVSERLQSVLGDLPSGAKPELGPITTGLGEIYFYTVEADKIETGEARMKQLMELRALQEWVLKPRIMTVRGVASVDTTGGYEKQYHVQPDPYKMSRYGIGFSEIRQALVHSNKNVGGGYIQKDGKQFLVQGKGIFESLEDISKVPVKVLESFKTITIGDVAQVNLGSSLRVGAALVEGKEAVLGMVYLLAGDNSRKVAQSVDEKMKEIQKILPQNVHIETLYNRSDLVNATINTVMHNLMTG